MLHAELQELYLSRALVCPNDRSLFYTTAAEHIANHPSLDTLEDWILTHRPAIIASVALAQQLGVSRTNAILSYPAFSPTPRVNEQTSLTAGEPVD
jgi:hypothetical protein